VVEAFDCRLKVPGSNSTYCFKGKKTKLMFFFASPTQGRPAFVVEGAWMYTFYLSYKTL